MSKLFLLTSKKTGIKFCISYLIIRILYIVNPLLTAAMIDAAVAKNLHMFIILACVSVCLFLLSQTFDFITDICEENCYADSFENLAKLIKHKLQHVDFHKTDISLNEINQLLGQDFEKANKYFFVEKIRFVYYLISIISIFVIMYLKSWVIATILLISLAVCIWLNLHFGKSISDKSEACINQMQEIKNIVNDQYYTCKEDRFHKIPQITDDLYNKNNSLFQKLFHSKNMSTSFYLNIISYGSLNGIILLSTILCDYFLLDGKLQIGTLYLFQSYTSQLWNPGEFIFSFRSKYKENFPIFKKIEQFEALPEMNDPVKYNLSSIRLSNYTGIDQNGNPLHQPLNLEFQKGNVYVIRGDNGVGKTTLIHNLLHLSNRYKGDILYDEQTSFIPDFSYTASKSFVSKYYNSAIAKSSDAQKKLFQIKNSLQDDSHVIIFDEPTNYLDTSAKKEFLSILHSIASEDKIVIIVTHDSDIHDESFKEIYISRNNAFQQV